MNYHNITKDDMLNGDGLRVVLWTAGCTHRCDGCHNPETWDLSSGKFNVSYEENKMTISMRELGLNEINSKYSEHTMVITYGASITDEAVLGETGNPNEVTLTWERTSEGHFDTLTDDAVVNTFGIDITKLFSDFFNKIICSLVFKKSFCIIYYNRIFITCFGV